MGYNSRINHLARFAVKRGNLPAFTLLVQSVQLPEFTLNGAIVLYAQLHNIPIHSKAEYSGRNKIFLALIQR